MKYNRKIKNKNIRYCLVGKRVFNRLRAAEEYCEKHNLDVDENILSENPKILEEAKNICRTILPILHDMKKELQDVYDEQANIYHRKVDDFKEAETKRDLLRDYKREQMQRALGILEGISMVRGVIDKQIQVHEQVKILHGYERKRF